MCVFWTSHTQVQPQSHGFSLSRHPTPVLSLSLSLPIWVREKSFLTRGTFLLHLAQLVHFLVMTTKKDRAHTLGTHLPRHGARESLSHGPARRQNCRALFTCKFSELDVAHSLFYSFVFFSLLRFSCLTPFNQIRLPCFDLPCWPWWPRQEESKSREGLWIHSILICIVSGI